LGVKDYEVESLINNRRYSKMADKNLTCKDCGSEFVFTEGEQEFYKEKGFENEPQRCPDCRRARKAQNNRGGNFSRDRR
jgi:hypothetical protein